MTVFAQPKDEQFYVKSASFNMSVPVQPTFPDKTLDIKFTNVRWIAPSGKAKELAAATSEE